MTLLKKHFYLFLVLLLLTFGCRSCDTLESDKVAQSEIHQSYSIHATTDEVKVIATFRVGGPTGTTVDLDSPSKIEYNGATLTENLRSILSGTIYTAESSEFQGNHVFTYTNGEGKVFRNQIAFEPLDPISGPLTISPSDKTAILLSRVVGENESVQASITSLEPTPQNSNSTSNTVGNKDPEGPSYSLDIPTNLNNTRTALIIGRGGLKGFAPGKAQLKITVRNNRDLAEKTPTGGNIGYEYISPGLNVTVAK